MPGPLEGALVGNDVVDLADPAAAGAHRRERFVARVCTDAERVALALAEDRRTFLWSLFAAKEAAYKVAVRLGPDPGLAHRRFEVAPDLTAVRFGELRWPLSVEVERGAGWVHAVVSTAGPAETLCGVVRIPVGSDESVAARRALRRAVALDLGCRVHDLAVVRDESPGGWTGLGPPRLLRRGRPVPGCISLSHDGRFAAFAVRPGHTP